MQMGIESNASDRKGKESNKSNSKKKRQKRVLAVQKLYETCKEVFADCGPGIVPSSENVDRLKAVLDGMTKADVGLRQNMPFFKNIGNDPVPRITYLHLYDCDKFSIGIFCLPPTSVIPLHNHPGMTVFSKLLFGTMHIKSYDWVDNGPADASVNANPPLADAGHPEGVRLAKVKVNSEFTAPCNTSILYPTDGGNMHCFTARTPCAVLDVLGPPYCDPEGRHCQYYFDFPFPNFKVDGLSVPEEDRDGLSVPEEDGDGLSVPEEDRDVVSAQEEDREGLSVPEEDRDDYAWLKEREKPEDVIVVGAKYNGPKIVAK